MTKAGESEMFDPETKTEDSGQLYVSRCVKLFIYIYDVFNGYSINVLRFKIDSYDLY